MSHTITIMLPYVYAGITQEYIKTIVGQLDMGTISGIDVRQVRDHQQAFIHLADVDTSNPSIQALNDGQTLEVTYDAQGHYWKMVKYIRRGPSPESHSRGYQMIKQREEREKEAIKSSILSQQQQNMSKIMEEIMAEQQHISSVLAGTADFNFEPTSEQQSEKVQPVIDTLTEAIKRPTLMTPEEKSALVRKFAEMMFYL